MARTVPPAIDGEAAASPIRFGRPGALDSGSSDSVKAEAILRDVEAAADRLHMTDAELAGALGLPCDGLEELRQTDVIPTPIAHALSRRAAALRDLGNHLTASFSSPEAIPIWLRAGSRHLGGRTPAEVLQDGRIDRVGAALSALDFGAFM